MYPRSIRVAIALLVLALIGIGYQYWFSDRARLNRRVTELESLLTKEGPEEAIVSAGQARAVTRMLAPDFLLLATPYEAARIDDPNQVLQGVVRLRMSGSTVDADLTRREIEIQPGSRTGVVSFLATLTIDFDDRVGRDSWLVRTLWREDEGRWLLVEAEVMERVDEGQAGLGIW